MVMPEITDDATLTMAVQALASFPLKLCLGARSIVARLGNVNARAICAVNSTLMPTQMIKFTSDTAFSETPRRAMLPMIADTVMATTSVTTNAVCSEPRRMVVTTRVTARADPRSAPARRTMDRY